MTSQKPMWPNTQEKKINLGNGMIIIEVARKGRNMPAMQIKTPAKESDDWMLTF